MTKDSTYIKQLEEEERSFATRVGQSRDEVELVAILHGHYGPTKLFFPFF